MPAEANEAAVEPGGWVDVLDQDSSGGQAFNAPVRSARGVAVAGRQQLHAERIRNEPVLERPGIASQDVRVWNVEPVARQRGPENRVHASRAPFDEPIDGPWCGRTQHRGEAPYRRLPVVLRGSAA